MELSRHFLAAILLSTTVAACSSDFDEQRPTTSAATNAILAAESESPEGIALEDWLASGDSEHRPTPDPWWNPVGRQTKQADDDDEGDRPTPDPWNIGQGPRPSMDVRTNGTGK